MSSSLTNANRSKLLVDSYNDGNVYTRNISSIEAMLVIKADVDDRINVVDKTIEPLLEGKVAEIISGDVNLIVDGLDPSISDTPQSLLKGKIKIADLDPNDPSTMPAKVKAYYDAMVAAFGDTSTIWVPVSINDVDYSSRVLLDTTIINSFPNLRIPNRTEFRIMHCVRSRENENDGTGPSLRSIWGRGDILMMLQNRGEGSKEWDGWYVQKYIPTAAWFTAPTDSEAIEKEMFTLDDYLKDGLENSSYYEIISSAIDKVIAGESNISDFVNELKLQFKDFSSGAAAILQTIKVNGLSVVGVCKSVKSFFGTVKSAYQEDVNHFLFTDNSQYMPKTLLFGVVGNILQNAAGVVALIGASIANWIVTLVGLVIFGVFKLINLGISSLKQKTLAQLDQQASLSCYSLGLLQRTLLLNSFSQWIQDNIMLNGCTQVRYPGCVLFFFLKDVVMNQDGTADPTQTTVGVEAHITYDLYPTNNVINWLYNYVHVDDGHQPSGFSVPSVPTTKNAWEDFMEEQTGMGSLVDVMAGMSEEDVDKYLRLTYIINWCFCFFVFYGSTTSSQALYREIIAVADDNGALTSSVISAADYITRFHNSNYEPMSWTSICSNDSKGLLRALFAKSFVQYGSFEDSGVVLSHGPGQAGLSLSEIIDLNILLAAESWDDYLALPVGGDLDYAIVPAAIAAQTFWRDVILLCLATAVVVTTTVIFSLKLKKKMQGWNAKHQASVESAWNAYSADPTNENYGAYRKAVLKNNWLTKLTGGTKYSYVNYWGETNSNDSSSLVLDRITKALSSEDEDITLGDLNEKLIELESKLGIISKLITGRN